VRYFEGALVRAPPKCSSNALATSSGMWPALRIAADHPMISDIRFSFATTASRSGSGLLLVNGTTLSSDIAHFLRFGPPDMAVGATGLPACNGLGGRPPCINHPGPINLEDFLIRATDEANYFLRSLRSAAFCSRSKETRASSNAALRSPRLLIALSTLASR
jgi:hypothetical protein